MAPRKRKATKTVVAAETELEQPTANSLDATEQMIETKKPIKKAALKRNAKPVTEVANDENGEISPKKTNQRAKRENTKKVINYAEQIDETPVKKKSRGKKAPNEPVEASENSENDKHVDNNTKQNDGNAKKRTKKNVAKDTPPPPVDEELVEDIPQTSKSGKSKKNEIENVAEVEAPKKKPNKKADKQTDSTKAQDSPVPKGRRQATDKPDADVVETKKSKKVTKKITLDATPEKKKPVKFRKAAKEEKKKIVEVKISPAKKNKSTRKEQIEKPNTNANGKKAKKSTDKETSDVNAVTTSQNLSSDEEHKPSKEEPVAMSRKRAAEIPKPNDTAVTKRDKKEKSTAEDKSKPKQKMNSTATDFVNIDFASDKEHTLKICSWNVAGLRALAAKNGFDYFEHEKPDIICLQEIKCLEEEVPPEVKIPGYHLYCCSKPGGRGGVALLSKKMPYNIENDIGDDEMDEEGRIITAEYSKFYLVCVYVPNAGRKLVNLDRRLRWNKLFEQHVNKLKAKKPVVILGDMNVAHNEIDLANPKTNTKNAGFSIEERDGMTDLLGHGFIDTFRHLYPERKDAYTFWSYMGGARAKNVGWRLDYGIVSDSLASKVVDNIIRPEVLGSDHCPMLLLLNV